MDLKRITDHFYVSAQIARDDLPRIAGEGIRSVVCLRPDGEGADQPSFIEIEAAARDAGLAVHYLPVKPGTITDEQAGEFSRLLESLPKPVLGYCRSGTRAVTLWTLAEAPVRPLADIVERARVAGYDMTPVARRIANGGRIPRDELFAEHDIVIVGAGAAGIAAASSLLARRHDLDVAIIDPAEIHYYQPGWTLVGGGVFTPESTVKTMAEVLPEGVRWIKGAVAAFEPENDLLVLEGCRTVKYKRLIVCPGLKLDWAGVDGLEAALGRGGVTSNYRFDLAPYTWKLVSSLRSGRALFTQPPMPIKCAGAPQKAMYLSGDAWRRAGVLEHIDIEFYNAGPVLFGVADYVPALMAYVERYGAALNFGHRLVAVDGDARKARFERKLDDGGVETIERAFDMLHVCPPQCAPDFLKVSALADDAGWLDVDQTTLRHKRFENVYGLGDATNAPNAKTAAAARKQAPVVARNLLADMGHDVERAIYDGYGSCPLTVERGKVVLAEFGYGGKLMPSFPSWVLNGRRPSRLAWLLKERILPPIYWKAMLKGREWLASPAAAAE